MTHSTVEFDGSFQRGSSVDGTEVIETREHRAGGREGREGESEGGREGRE